MKGLIEEFMDGIMDNNKCLGCNLSNFGNLYNRNAELEGGELFVLRESIEQKKILPCQLTYPLDPSFDIWKEAYISLEEDRPIEELGCNEIFVMPPIIYFTWQILFDLKASVFLALTAHYRSAIQLLRPSLENIIISRYFQENIRLATDDEKLIYEYKAFLNWSEKTDISKINFNSSIQYLTRKDIIKPNGNETARVGELWESLNKYLHSYLFKWDKGDTPEVVHYDEDSLNEWLDLYQNILSYMIEMLCHYLPEAIKTQNGQNALIKLKEMESIENDCGIRLIKSNYLRKFLAQISPEGKLPQETGLSCSILRLPYPED